MSEKPFFLVFVFSPSSLLHRLPIRKLFSPLILIPLFFFVSICCCGWWSGCYPIWCFLILMWKVLKFGLMGGFCDLGVAPFCWICDDCVDIFVWWLCCVVILVIVSAEACDIIRSVLDLWFWSYGNWFCAKFIAFRSVCVESESSFLFFFIYLFLNIIYVFVCLLVFSN